MRSLFIKSDELFIYSFCFVFLFVFGYMITAYGGMTSYNSIVSSKNIYLEIFGEQQHFDWDSRVSR